MRFLDVWYARIDADNVLAELAATRQGAVKAAQKTLAKAQTRTSLGSLAKFAQRVDGGYRIKQQPPVIVRPPEDALRRLRADHPPGARRLRPLAGPRSARRARPLPLRGLRAQGRRRRLGRDRGVHDPARWATARTIRCSCRSRRRAPRCSPPTRAPSEYEHQGERVVQGQRLMQSASDAFLGWVTGTGSGQREFYVRQLRDMKGSAVVETMTPERLARYGELCGADAGARARPHRRRREDRRLPRRRRHVRPRHRTLRGRLRRPERARLRGVHRAADEQRIAVERGV